MDLKNLNRVDPLKRFVEKESGDVEFSPMDPPDAYSPPNLDSIPYEEMHPCLKHFIDEHHLMTTELLAFEKALVEFKRDGWVLNKDMDKKFSAFFSFMDDAFTKHHLKEEKVLFPLLQKKLMEIKEHGQGPFPKTAIDLLEDDHVKITQYLTLIFNLMALAVRLPDLNSRALTFDVVAEQGFALIELLKLHIFREENVAFPKANQHITSEEFEPLLAQMKIYDHYWPLHDPRAETIHFLSLDYDPYWVLVIHLK